MVTNPNTERRTLLDATTLREADERPAIIYVAGDAAPIHVSRRAFRDTAAATARALRGMGTRPGDLIAIAHTQNLESIHAFWGALLMGAIPSMFPTLTDKLDPDVYMQSMSELVRLSRVAAVLTTDEFAPALRPHLPCPVYSSADLQRPRDADPQPEPYVPDPAAVAFLQHSSGTTGLQKGVALSHAAVLNQLAAYSRAIELCENDVIVSWLPLYHDMGLIAGFLMPLILGVPLVLMSPFDWVSHPALLLRAIHDYRGTLCWLPNFAYNHCVRAIRRRDSDDLSLSSMRLFINCSEPVRHDSQQLFLERFASLGLRAEMLGVSYAMAENTFAVTQTAPGAPAPLDIVDAAELDSNNYAKSVPPGHPHARTLVSCGPTIPGTTARIVDDENRPLPDRAVGQIAIRSDCLMSGYYRRDDLQPFDAEGWFLTGDMGYLANGELYVAGRRKDLIINAGKNIYPADLEAVVNAIPGVKAGRAVVFGVEDERAGTELIAVVAEVATTDDGARREIERAIRRAIVRQTMVSVTWVHLVGPKWLLKTSSGKIARAANRDKWRRETGLAGQ